jgi:MFS family permease
MLQVLACGAAIVTLSMGIRHGFGLWLQPITQAQGWTRETFSFALAVQNLTWGVAGVFAGMLADRFGAFRVLVGGAALYGLGLVGMALAPDPWVFALTAGVMIGAAQAGTTYSVIYGVIGRQIDPAKRSWAMGMAAAAGSFGQFLMVPVEGMLIANLGWQQALIVLGVAALLIGPLALGLREPGFMGATPPPRDQTIVQALREAARYPSFQLLVLGYFVCGFQVVFIGVHMPSYLKDKGLTPEVASYALALIGLFNVFGTYIAGALGQKLAKQKILAFIYVARAVVIAVFLVVPLSPLSDFRCGPPVHVGRHCLFQPPDRLLHGRLAGWLPVRPYGQLRRRLVHLDRPGPGGRRPEPAGAGHPDPARARAAGGLTPTGLGP